MIRTQIQLSEKQAKAIKVLSASWGVSSAEVIRKAIDTLMKTEPVEDGEQKRLRALSIVGKFSSGKRDVSKRHDDYLAEAYSK